MPLDQIFDKIQLTKLLIQTLKEMGYNDSALSLQFESGGLQVESNYIQTLFNLLNTNDFSQINFNLLSQLPLHCNKDKFTLKQQCINNNINIGVPSTNDSMKIDNIIDFNNNNNTINNITNNHANNNDIIQNLQRQTDIWKSIANQCMKSQTINKSFCQSFLITLQIFFLIQRQFFYHLIINQSDFNLALSFLRNYLQPSWQHFWENDSIDQDHNMSMISMMLMIDPIDPMFTRGNETLIDLCSKILTNPHLITNLNQETDLLIQTISNCIDPDDLIPQGRLITLLKQSIKYQKSTNFYNIFQDDTDTDTNADHHQYSLLSDNIDLNLNYHFQNVKTLDENNDEIWYLQFSPDGKYLASATADSLMDRKIIIYDVQNNFQVYRVLAGNNQCILYLSFSPDGQHLVACPFNENANIYFIHAKGEPLSNYNDNNDNNEEEEEGKNLPELIYPIDSLDISKTPQPQSSTNHNNSQSYNQENQSSGTSPRVWCCDWFHGSSHENILVLGSPDRDVVFYNFDNKTMIYSMADNMDYNHQETTNSNPSHRRRTHNNNNDDDVDMSDDDDDNDNDNDHNPLGLTSQFKKLFPRVHDLKISNDDHYLILMTHKDFIEVYDISQFPTNDQLIKSHNSILETFNPIKISNLNIGKKMTCISLPQDSPNSNFQSKLPKDNNLYSLNDLLLVNLQFNEIQLWNYKENILIQKFYGQKQEDFIIRSCFGYNNKIIISGSEDGKIYIWNRINGNILQVLSGHDHTPSSIYNSNDITKNKNQIDKGSSNSNKFTKNCNVVAWNPWDKNVFVSGGDDGLIKVWKIVKD